MGNLKIFLKFIILFLTITGLLCVQTSAIKADAGIMPVHGTAPLNVMFTDLSEGKPIEWHWDFGDGYAGDGPRTMHTYTVPGTYTVTLLVLDARGLSDTVTFNQIISVSANPFMPIIPMVMPSFSADFTGGPQSGLAPLSVSFSDLSKGEPNTWLWDFGDGTNSIEQNPVHIYSSPGTYSVMLKISKDSSTGMKERKNYITVGQGTNIHEQYALNSTLNTPIPETSVHLLTTSDEIMGTAFLTNAIYDKTSFCDPEISMTLEPEKNQPDEKFVIVITGKPLEKIYFWISTEEEKILDSATHPLITDDEMVFDKPEGPFTIGSFIPVKETGKSIIDLIINNQSQYLTRLYGMTALDKNGEHKVTVQTEKVAPGIFIANAITEETENEEGCIEQLELIIQP